MKLRDILPDSPIAHIQVKCYELDMSFGYCSWTGTELISLDGDVYFLDEEIVKYKFNDDGSLTYWINWEWISG
jgi:hypothetical protein